MLASRKITEAAAWAASLKGTPDAPKTVEGGKSKFAGPEILGKTLGVIGLGAIGGKIANAAVDLGMKVVGYDPYLSVNGALHLDPSVKVVTDINEIYTASDYITIHVPYTPDTKNTIDAEQIAMMKDGVRLLYSALITLLFFHTLELQLLKVKIIVQLWQLMNLLIILKTEISKTV